MAGNGCGDVNGDQVAEFIEAAITARLEDRRPYLIGMIDGLVDGPSAADAAQVVVTMATAASETLEKADGEDFYAFRPWRFGPDGEPVACDAGDLAPWDRTFGQMAVAMANGDRDAALAMFTGYVSHDRTRAARLVAVGLNQLAHIVTCPNCCPPGLRGWSP